MKTFLIGGLVAGSVAATAAVGVVTLVPDWRQRIGLVDAPQRQATAPSASTVTPAPQASVDAPAGPGASVAGTATAPDGPADADAPAKDADAPDGETEIATAPATAPADAAPEAAPDAAHAPGEADPDAPDVDIVRIDPEGQAVIAGRAEPGATVEALIDGKVVATETADQDGGFVIVTDIGTSDDARALQLRSARTGAAPGDAAEEPAAVAGEATGEATVASADAEGAAASDYALGAPIVILPGETEDAAPTVVEAGETEVAVVQPSATATGRLVLDRITYSPGGDAVAAGRGRPGNAVRAYANAVFVADAPIGASGDWRIVLPREVAEAAQLLRFDEVTVEGVVASRLETPFSYDQDGGPQEARGRELVVQRGDNLWRIAEQYYGEGLRYSVIFGANSKLIRDPDLIYPGQVFTIPEMVSAE